MTNADLRGVWTYRSFADDPTPVGSFDKIRIWEAELYLDTPDGGNTLHGHLGERPPTALADSPYLNLIGKVSQGRPQQARWRAVGAPGTAFAGWIYDYEGFVAPFWPSGLSQRTCIVGTVTRTVAHDRAPAGRAFSFIAVKRDFREPKHVIPIADAALQHFASERMRLHHQLWHAARNAWDDVGEPVRNAIRKLSWQPGPARKERHALGSGSRNNGSGEDFLYMHRRMIRDARRLDSELLAWASASARQTSGKLRSGIQRDTCG